MTLSTDILVCEPVNPERVFRHGLSLLARAVSFEPRWEHCPAGDGVGFKNAHYVSECGQGLPAWLWVHYASDGPLTYYDPDDHEYFRETRGDAWSPPWFDQHCIRIDFDTAYGYKGPNGQGCSDLHAWLVQEMVEWLADNGATKVVWKNEFTGEWFDPTETGALLALGDPERGRL